MYKNGLLIKRGRLSDGSVRSELTICRSTCHLKVVNKGIKNTSKTENTRCFQQVMLVYLAELHSLVRFLFGMLDKDQLAPEQAPASN